MLARIRAVAAQAGLLVVVALAGCSDTPGGSTGEPTGASGALSTSTTTTSSPTTTTTEPLPLGDPATHGSFEVGRSSFTVTDPARDGREMAVDVWYPAPAGVSGKASVYDLPGDATVEAEAVDGPKASAGPFPLVVFSHAGGGLRFQSLFLAEALASHGFVVAAPEHTGNTVVDQIEGTGASFDEVAVDRPLDVSRVIDRMLERSDSPGDLLAHRIDPDAVGVVGHALGGFAALATAGGTDSVEADERVSAAVAIAPLSSLLSDGNLAAVEVATLLVGGTADDIAPIDDRLTRPFSLVGTDEVRRVDVEGAAHWSFTDICRLSEAIRDAGADPGVERPFAVNAVSACGDGALPADDAKRITNHYVVAFLRVHLAGDDRYAGHLESIDGAAVHVR